MHGAFASPFRPRYDPLDATAVGIPAGATIHAMPSQRDTGTPDPLDHLLRDLAALQRALSQDNARAPAASAEADEGAREEARLIARVRGNAEDALARMIAEVRTLKDVKDGRG